MKGGDEKHIARWQALHIDLTSMHYSCTNTARALESPFAHTDHF